MNYYDYFINQLINNGMFENQAKEVMTKVVAKNPTMKGRWGDNINNYQPVMLSMIWLDVEKEALKYIEETCPQAWFKPMFDKEHPLRKEFENQFENQYK